MKLIIAEKPSLARNIAAAIGGMKSRGGYMEGEQFLITWAFGHLFTLADVEDYQPKEPNGDGKKSAAPARWTLRNLPCFPEKFKFVLRRGSGKGPDKAVKEQFAVIKTLCQRPDVDAIINAGDADREGEIIVRICVDKALRKGKEQLRLWLPDQTPQTIREALASMQPDSAYDNLANEGYARTYIDWLYGVNLTRYATLRTGTLLRVGRVIVPIVRAIYDRDMEIRNFVPVQYLSPFSAEETGGEKVELLSKKRFAPEERAQAEELCRLYNEAGAVVTAVKQKKETLWPGKLYSLSKLQNVLGKKYKMSMAESLAIVQKLYEQGYLTYPRTNSEYLATAEQDKVRQILENCRRLGYPVAFRFSKSIFDDSKIESHSAITPTFKIPEKSKLTEREYQVYATVFRRFAAVFCTEECVVERSEITIAVGDYESFTLKGTVMLEKGWTKYDDCSLRDRLLPRLAEGDAVNIRFAPVEKETAPPKHYTIETLNNYLKNPFRKEKEAAEDTENASADDSEEYRAVFEGLELGTEATRTGIIDNARKSEYIALTKDVYTILPDGEYLIRSLEALKIGMDKYKTAEMGKVLKRVYRGECSVQDSLSFAEQEISGIFTAQTGEIEKAPPPDAPNKDLGKCPLCGKSIIKTRYGYGCSGYKDGCKFLIYGKIAGKKLTEAQMRMLASKGKTNVIHGFTAKSGRAFDAALRLEDGKVVFDFGDKTAPKAPKDKK